MMTATISHFTKNPVEFSKNITVITPLRMTLNPITLYRIQIDPTPG
jgi:hypothetical protein